MVVGGDFIVQTASPDNALLYGEIRVGGDLIQINASDFSANFVSNSELSADFVSTSPKSGHTFKAYDHTETLTVTFKNNGSDTWDSSYSLVFYSGYNWMHIGSFSLPGTVAQGEKAVFSLPMEIYEDNDKWETCWYLASPDGKNLSDFCFSYYTGS